MTQPPPTPPPKDRLQHASACCDHHDCLPYDAERTAFYAEYFAPILALLSNTRALLDLCKSRPSPTKNDHPPVDKPASGMIF